MMETYNVKISGTLPLLHGRKDPRGDPPGGSAKDAWYDAQWKYTNYSDEDGNLYQPAYIVKSMLVQGMRATAKSGDSEKGKGKTEQMARACLRISPVAIPFGAKIPDDGEVRVLDPMGAWSLKPADSPQVFVLRRLCSRGVEVSNLAIANWQLAFVLVDTSDGFFDVDWLKEGLDYSLSYIGMGSWRPDFGLGHLDKFTNEH